jgi:electron transfer flavoprotein beta subunit
MHLLVLLRMVPDVVEELEIAPSGKALDLEFLRMIVSESDDHALEQALLLKERHGGKVTVLAVDAPDVDDVLYSALGKGADRAMKIVDAEGALTTRETARVFAQVISNEPGLMPADIILTGVQAIDDLDGLIAPLLSHELGLPYLAIVTRLSVDPSARLATAVREYPGGIRGEFELPLPAVLGIQAAEKPPRYIPVAKVRAAMKSLKIECASVPTLADGGVPVIQVLEMSKPQVGGHAAMLEGAPEQVSGRLSEILAERGLL